MPDGGIVNVRQIAGFPSGTPTANDLVLLQQGGLGGPYFTASPLALLAPLQTSNLAVGIGLPDDAGRGNLGLLALGDLEPGPGQCRLDLSAGHALGFHDTLSLILWGVSTIG